MATATGLQLEDKVSLETKLREMAKLQLEMAERKKRFDELKDEAFPLVEIAGDVYEVDGIKAQIEHPTTLEINAVRLLKRFGETAHGLLTVSVKKYRAAVESGLLGTKKDHRSIAKQVDQTPRFVLSQ